MFVQKQEAIKKKKAHKMKQFCESFYFFNEIQMKQKEE